MGLPGFEPGHSFTKVPQRYHGGLALLLIAYREVVNGIVRDAWDGISWKETTAHRSGDYRSSVPMRQRRLIPRLNIDRRFKAMLRQKYMQDWVYAAHWIDSAESCALAIMRSWKRNYDKGERGRKCPIVKRLFARIKQSLLKLEGDRLRITLRPNDYVWIDLSRRWFKLPDEVSALGLGEPTITPSMIHLPIYSSESSSEELPRTVGWDFNFDSLDGFSPQTGWIRIDTRRLLDSHRNSSAKLASIRRKLGKSRKGMRLAAKYQHRELNRAKKHQIEIARVMRNSSRTIVVEDLNKARMLKGGTFNYRLAVSDWGSIARLSGERSKEVPSRWTSKNCSRCGWTNRDLNGACVFECRSCGLRIDRQLNASIGIYERGEGVPHESAWWDARILPSLVGGYFQAGAESKAADELVRSLDETVKPQVEYGYDRYADAYLPRPN